MGSRENTNMIDQEIYRHWVTHLEDRIRQAVVSGRSTDEACATVERQAREEFGFNQEVLVTRLRALGEAATAYRQKLERVSYMQRVAVRWGREHWYAGPAENADNWIGLRQRLIAQGRSPESVSDLDEESTTVISLLDNPGRAEFSTRGLVVGYVQSGKTANMSAVIAKAADTPFKFFLVLSGMTDALRNQTQERLDKDVIGTAPHNRWMPWTSRDTEDTKGDFHHPAAGGFAIDNRNQIAVIKKNGAVLRRFLAKLRNTDEATLRNTPILIIDDECDQASINSAALDKAVSRINGYIREILKRVPRVAYVGYTATPFANVLIDTTVKDDLYPRSFIHALRRPQEYFGAERLFGREALEGNHEDLVGGLDMIRLVPEKEVPELRPKSGTKETPFNCEVTPALAEAIRYFVLVTAAREMRGQHDEHSTMLVHTSVLNSIHRSTEKAIRPHLDDLIERLEMDDSGTIEEMQKLWEEEQDRVLAEMFDRTPVPFERLRPLLASVAASIEIKVENWSSDNRIDYSEPARRYLVIGGNVLARGLTLEGLSVSFFLRSSSQYDTLMQMGRWFGYRHGIEDLPRVWMEEDIRNNFFDLATVEAEIRRDIRRYAEEEITPEDFGVRIRRIPGMTITAPAKMRSARTVDIDYAGSHQQTTRFYRKDSQWLSDNWAAAAELLKAVTPEEPPRGNNRIVRGVPVERIVKFLETYRIHPSHKQMGSELLREYIRQQVLDTWNIVVIGGPKLVSDKPLGAINEVHCVLRSALPGASDEACIKALMSKRDVLADVDDMGVPVADQASWDRLKAIRQQRSLPPLLLLYPIEKESQPYETNREKKDRVPLAAVHDVLGIGIVFPGKPAKAQVYVAANLVPEEAVEIPEGDDALPGTVIDTEQVP